MISDTIETPDTEKAGYVMEAVLFRSKRGTGSTPFE